MRISDWSSDVCSSDLLPRPGSQEVVRDHRGDADRPRPLPHHLQHQTSTPGRRHEGTHPAKGLHRRPAGNGECKDETDAQSRLTQARPDAARLSGDYRLRPVISKRPCLCLLAPFDRMRPPGRYRLSHLGDRSEEHTSELQSLMRISYAVFCLKKKKTRQHIMTATLYTTQTHEQLYTTHNPV